MPGSEDGEVGDDGVEVPAQGDVDEAAPVRRVRQVGGGSDDPGAELAAVEDPSAGQDDRGADVVVLLAEEVQGRPRRRRRQRAHLLDHRHVGKPNLAP